MRAARIKANGFLFRLFFLCGIFFHCDVYYFIVNGKREREKHRVGDHRKKNKMEKCDCLAVH